MTNYILRTEEAKNNCFLELVRSSVGEMPPIEVVFRTYRQKRSVQQNALLHKWFDEIAKVTGEYTPDDIKTLM